MSHLTRLLLLIFHHSLLSRRTLTAPSLHFGMASRLVVRLTVRTHLTSFLIFVLEGLATDDSCTFLSSTKSFGNTLPRQVGPDIPHKTIEEVSNKIDHEMLWKY